MNYDRRIACPHDVCLCGKLGHKYYMLDGMKDSMEISTAIIYLRSIGFSSQQSVDYLRSLDAEYNEQKRGA